MIFYHNSNCPHSIFLIYVILRLSVNRVPLRLKDVYGYVFLSFFFLFLSLKVKICQYFRLTATFFFTVFRLMVSLIETLL